MKKHDSIVIILMLISLPCLPSCAKKLQTFREEKKGDTYLYLGEKYAGSRYKPMYVLDCQTENQYEDKGMTLNETWFSMRADATYVRSGYYDPYERTFDYAKITYNVSRYIRPDDWYWGYGAFYLTDIERIIAVENQEIIETVGFHHQKNEPYTKNGLDFYEVKADFYKQMISIINDIVSQEPVVRKNKY